MSSRVRPILNVWLRGEHLATLREPTNYRYEITFTEQALQTYPEGTPALSLSLPVTSKGHADHPTDPRRQLVSAFLEGLLPEGQLRTQVAADAGVPKYDKMSLLRQVGAECAGAVQFLPEGLTPSHGTVRPLAQLEVDEMVRDLPTYHLPDGVTLQASLAGIQAKILLTRMADSTWGWPQGGAISTHLVKPEPAAGAALAHLIHTEEWALRVARRAGLATAEATIESFGERDAIVVTRYDRLPDGTRLHQEDFCQALGLDPDNKYETPKDAQELGSRLSRVVERAAPRNASPSAFRTELLTFVTFNVIIGNGDAHSKNYSLLLAPSGEVQLAPLYDTAPVAFLDSRYGGIGHVVNGKHRIVHVDLDDLVAEGRTWGLGERLARRSVTDVVDRVWQAVHSEALPEDATHVLPRLEGLWRSRSWRS